MRNRINVLRAPRPKMSEITENMEWSISDVLESVARMISTTRTSELMSDARDIQLLAEALATLRNKRRSTAHDRIAEAENLLNQMRHGNREYFIEQFNYYMENDS